LKQSLFDKLNLRPNERRLVIIVAIVVFIILNFIFVWPKFGDWGKIKARRTIANGLITQYERELANTKRYQLEMKDLETQGAAVASEEQAVKLSTTVQNQAALSGVQVNRYDPVRQTALSSGGKTNQFFEEQSGIINVVTEEKALVDFLYNLGDPPRHRLQGNITLVASYAKKAPPKAVAPATGAKPTSTTTAAKPASPFTKTNAPGKITNSTSTKK
jgi:hypothetical protein